MALPSKSRNNRRPSTSTSYTSTLTTLVFIALCVLGIWMLTSNSVVSPKTRTAVDNSAAINDFSSTEDQTETTTTNNNSDDSTEIATNTNNNSDDSTETTTTNNYNSDDSTETTTNTNNNNSDDSTAETTTTTTNVSEEPPETNTKVQDQKDTTVYGDNPGNLPDDAIKNGDANTNNDQPKQERASQISEETSFTQKQHESGSDSDHKNTAQVSELGNRRDEEAERNTDSQNANAGENQEQSMGGTGGGQQDVQSFDTDQGSKSNELDEVNEQQLREDKGEIMEKDQKQRSNEEPKENNQNVPNESDQKPKPEKSNRRKSSKSSKKPWSTQADESRGEKERQKNESGTSGEEVQDLKWSLCNVTVGADYIPCLDNEKYLRTSHRKHYEHRERHCPEDAPTCLVPLPEGYKTPIPWPSSRDKIWYHNIPHTELADVKGHQNWVKLTGEFLTFPGGGTQFIHGALHYIDFLQQAEPGIAWGKHTRVILDVGCGVGSFGGFLFERDVIAMSFAPKDEHEAQVQFALERGIPAISAVMGTQRLQFPSHVFDLVHCARCRVPWHEDGGMLLLELNRVLRPGGYFVWSATPVYQTLEEDVEIWKQMTSLTKAMCWDLVTIKNDTLNQVGAAFYRKPTSNECYEQREQNQPPICKDDDDPNAAWYVPLQACMHKLPVDNAERGARWPEAWPRRLQKAPYWLNNAQGGKPSPQDFTADTERWKNIVDELSNMGVTWSNVRNVMDMRAVYGGFAAALKDLPVWVFNVVNMDSPDTLPIIYERGLIGIYHDWCESFSTYPRTYDLLHADHLFSNLKNRCKLIPVMAEVDRILRPGGHLIVRDESSAIDEVENLLKSLHWEITSKNQEGVLSAKKGNWRPNSYVDLY